MNRAADCCELVQLTSAKVQTLSPRCISSKLTTDFVITLSLAEVCVVVSSRQANHMNEYVRCCDSLFVHILMDNLLFSSAWNELSVSPAGLPYGILVVIPCIEENIA